MQIYVTSMYMHVCDADWLVGGMFIRRGGGGVVWLEEKRFSLQRSVYRKDRTAGQLRNGSEEGEKKKTGLRMHNHYTHFRLEFG